MQFKILTARSGYNANGKRICEVDNQIVEIDEEDTKLVTEYERLVQRGQAVKVVNTPQTKRTKRPAIKVKKPVVDWTEVKGIGNAIADALYQMDIYSKADLLERKGELENIPGLSESRLAALVAFASEGM